MEQIELQVKTILVGTRNTIDFEADFRRQALEFVISYSKEAVERAGYKPVPAMLMEAREEADGIGAY